MRRTRWIGLGLATLFLALRGPSLLEPNWYSDEGTYADVAAALDRGAALYRDVWDNKPPGMYWLAAAVIRVAGPGAPAFHLVLALLLGLGAVAVWRLGRRFGGAGVAAAATATFVVLTGLPNLDGGLLNAEIVGAALTLGAMLLATGPPRWWRGLGAGALVGAAMLVKAVFVLDLAAVLGAIALSEAARSRVAARSSRLPPAMALAAIAGAGLVILAALAFLAAAGSLPGFLDVLFRQNVAYVQLTIGPGGGIVEPSLGARAAATALLALRVLAPLAAGAWLAWRMLSRGRAATGALADQVASAGPSGSGAAAGAPAGGAVVAWWLACDLAGVMLASRGLTHYAQQAEGSIALAAGVLAVTAWRRAGRRAGRDGERGRSRGAAARPERPHRPLARLMAIATPLLAWPALELALYLPAAEVALATRATLPPIERHDLSDPVAYYAAAWRRLTTGAPMDPALPADVARIHAAEAVVRERSGPGDHVLVWGVIHWVYAETGRPPSGPYVSLNDAYHLDPAAEPRLLAAVEATPPAVLIVDTAPPLALTALLERLRYQRLPGAVAGDDAWLAPWARGYTAPG
ncbi:MAG TPA: glycosyltransferase family 39 protein [Candidatus Dormibacteraeota bacterium]|jgi:hypothetical protein|nr:glycosyltransferase family 39 protein [Candidatus Dormibacteraeota bacterium]